MQYFKYEPKDSVVNNKKKFILYCILNFCQCKKSCLQVKEYSFSEEEKRQINSVYSQNQQNLSKCSLISLEKDEYQFDFIENLKKIIEFFISIGLIRQKRVNREFLVKYYSENRYKQFNWKNISILPNADREIFWFFRKVVVDSILKNVLKEHFINTLYSMKIVSVGSTKLSSDYDITLYTASDFSDNETIKKHFSDTLYSLLGSIHSDKLFDTNIYTTSYISFKTTLKNSTLLYKEHKCYNINFYYVKYDEMTSLSENVWAFLHFYKVIYEYFSHDIATTIWNYVFTKLGKNAKHLNLLPELYDKMKTMYSGNSDILSKLNYNTNKKIQKSVRILENNKNFDFSDPEKKSSISKFIKSNKTQIDTVIHSNTHKELLLLYDRIAFINFYGVDTYFTRGAFLDVVVNCQMCHYKNEESIILTDNDYLNSFVENISFLILYPNSNKYLIRITNCINNMEILQKYRAKLTRKFINKIKKVQESCRSYEIVSVSEISLQDCNYYGLFQYCINLCVEVSNIYFSKNPYSDVNKKLDLVSNEKYAVPLYGILDY